MGMFSESQAKDIDEVFKQQLDFNKRVLPVIEQQQKDLDKYGANLGKTADALSRLEEEYKRNHEPALKEIRTQHAEFKSSLDEIIAGQQKMIGIRQEGEEIRKSFGHKIVTGPEYKALVDSRSQGRYLKPIEIDDRKTYLNALAGNMVSKAWDSQYTGLQSTSLSTLRDITTTDRLSELFAEPLRQDRVRDYIPVIPVEGSSVEYWQQTDFADDGNRPNVWTGNQAATVAEMGQKPYSTMTGTSVIAPIRTLAHLFVMSEQLMADAPAFARHVDLYMRGGLDEKEDVQVLKGSGTGSDLEGLMLRSGIQSFVQDTDSEVGDNIIDSIARAYARVKKASHTPDTLLLGIGAETSIKLAKGSDGQYLWGAQAMAGGQPRIWGLPLNGTSALDDDEGVMGAFRMSVGLLDRMVTTLRVSDSHDNLFALNMVALRYEKRIGLMVVRLKGVLKLLLNGQRQS